MLGWLALAATLFLSGTANARVLDVPYRSQLDGSPYALANCGPTALSMTLAFYGIDASPWNLRVKSMQTQHSWVNDQGGYSDRYGVWVYNLATVAEGYGVHADDLWSFDAARSDHYYAWRPDDLRREIQLGHPVILEVAYRWLPAHAGSRAPDDHYVVLRGLLPDGGFVYSDPMNLPDEEISESGLVQAMAKAGAPFAGFALVKP